MFGSLIGRVVDESLEFIVSLLILVQELKSFLFDSSVNLNLTNPLTCDKV